MEKVNLSTDETRVNLTIPFAKINESKRTVSGFATIDNVDTAADVITAEASTEAFNTFRGNVREMHKDIAAGKVLNYRPEEFLHEGTVYNGIYVDVYVSKGAPDTWEKVLDGTLSGFSVKGDIKQCHSAFVPDENRTVRYITKYNMTELSLVDSPGNQFCNVLSLQKMDDGSTQLAGLVEDTKVSNVFWCNEDRIAVSAGEELRKCSICSSDMENVGWYEPSEEVPTNESISKILQASNKLEKNLNVTEGGSKMSEEVTEEVKSVEETEASVVEEATQEVSETVAKTDEPDLATISKALDEIHAALTDTTVKNNEKIVSEIQKSVAAVKEDFDTKLDSLIQKHTQLEQEVQGFKDGLGSVEKAIAAVSESFEKSTAIKKSSDVESESSFQKNDEKTSLWSGRFLPDNYDQ